VKCALEKIGDGAVQRLMKLVRHTRGVLKAFFYVNLG